MSRVADVDAFSNQPVVIDHGSGLLKAGFAGAEMPKVIFPAYVGRPKHVRVMAGSIEGEVFVGDAAKEMRGICRLSYPTRHGIIVDWEDVLNVWKHTYSELGVSGDQHPVLLTEAALNPRSNRVKAAEMFFETFQVPAFYVELQPILSLYASGKTTGIVLDSGDGVTASVPIVEGFCIPHAIQRIEVAGRDITHYLQLLLRKAGCYVAYNIDAHDKDEADDVEPEVPYKLPDGSVIQLSSEKYRAPELLFQPSLVGVEEQGKQAIYRKTF